MRTPSHGPHHRHYHDGGTCLGAPSLEECAQHAIASGWMGRILEKTDTLSDGTEVKCYSLICDKYGHWGKQGRWVAEIKLAVTLL